MCFRSLFDMLDDVYRVSGRRDEQSSSRRTGVRHSVSARVYKAVRDEEVISLLEVVHIDGDSRDVLRDRAGACDVDVVSVGIPERAGRDVPSLDAFLGVASPLS